MNLLQIISGSLLLLSSLIIIIIVLMQESKDQGMTSAITGATNDSFYGKNSSRTRDAKLARFTRTAAIVLFLVTMLVNILAVYSK